MGTGMPQPVVWLPRDAIAAAAERLPVRETVCDWAVKWFARGGASLSGVTALTGVLALTGEVMEVDDGMMLVAPADAIKALGVLMFGEPKEVTTVADRAAIEAAAEQALADLRQRAAQLVGLPRDAAWRVRSTGIADAGYCFKIRAGQASLTLFVTDRVLIAGVKARLRPAASRPLGEIATGLDNQEIALSARLGACRLSMIELAGLATGDVVVLDRALADPADLVIDRLPQRAPCTIAAGANHFDLTLA
jgi:flagellar motor switch/type III secretory pathway protein FliN